MIIPYERLFNLSNKNHTKSIQTYVKPQESSKTDRMKYKRRRPSIHITAIAPLFGATLNEFVWFDMLLDKVETLEKELFEGVE